MGSGVPTVSLRKDLPSSDMSSMSSRTSFQHGGPALRLLPPQVLQTYFTEHLWHQGLVVPSSHHIHTGGTFIPQLESCASKIMCNSKRGLDWTAHHLLSKFKGLQPYNVGKILQLICHFGLLSALLASALHFQSSTYESNIRTWETDIRLCHE